MIETSTWGDPINQPYWRGALEHKLLVQKCQDCEVQQLYGRPHCLQCGSIRLHWMESGGRGFIYSMTTVRMAVHPDIPPPYALAIVELDEGPRLLTTVIPPVAIGSRVLVRWRARPGMPPIPIFAPEKAL